MTAAAITVAQQRGLYPLRRDLVLAASDSLELTVTVMETDDPTSPAAIATTGGIGGPAVRVVLFADRPFYPPWGDYGRPFVGMADVLWSGAATNVGPGMFSITVPQGTFTGWEPRCGYAITLDWNGGLSSQLLVRGALNIIPALGTPALTAEVITTDELDPITTD
jgi:hypothetical protein